MKYLYIGIGGAIGALFRFILSTFIMKIANTFFPLGTLIVNIFGCFLIGFIFFFLERSAISSNIRLFIFVGLLGGFTTFSSFAMETVNLLRNGQSKYALLNIVFTNFLGITFIIIGFIIAKLVTKLLIK